LIGISILVENREITTSKQTNMSEEAATIELVADQEARQNWGNLFALLDQSAISRQDNKGLIDQALLQLVYGWLNQRDECGVVKDLLDIGLYNVAGTTLDQLAGENLAVSREVNVTQNATEAQALASGKRTAQFTNQHDGGRNLQFFTEEQCTGFQSTIFLGSMLSFSSCANIDLGKFFGSVEENIVNAGLHCLNTFIQPFQSELTCASRNHQNYVMDQCIQTILKDDVLGHVFQLFLVSPKKTCGCMSALAEVPICRVNITRQVSLDGMFTSKMACMMQTEVCDKLEGDCDARLTVLHECLPDLSDINSGNFDCEEVMCNCEKNDKGLLNYPGRAMELPMSDMCTDKAETNFAGFFITERYALFQDKCGAEFLTWEDEDPTASPTVSSAPSMSPTTAQDREINSAIMGRQDATPVNSVVTGILLALAITGIASIFLVFVLVLWRRRFRSKGKQVKTIAQMKAQALEQIRKLEDEVRRMEEQEEEVSSTSDF
jgi:hypothetical protein